jgi:hypothetical protein
MCMSIEKVLGQAHSVKKSLFFRKKRKNYHRELAFEVDRCETIIF